MHWDSKVCVNNQISTLALVLYLILNNKKFAIVLSLNSKHFSHAITINLGICQTTLYELYNP